MAAGWGQLRIYYEQYHTALLAHGSQPELHLLTLVLCLVYVLDGTFKEYDRIFSKAFKLITEKLTTILFRRRNH